MSAQTADICLRDMTPDERRGYELALRRIQTWARQTTYQSNAMDQVPIASITMGKMMRNNANFANALAEALLRGP